MRKSSFIKWILLAIVTILAEIISQNWQTDWVFTLDIFWEPSPNFFTTYPLKMFLLIASYIVIAANNRINYTKYPNGMKFIEFILVTIIAFTVSFYLSLTSYALSLGFILIVFTSGPSTTSDPKLYTEAGQSILLFAGISLLSFVLISATKFMLTFLMSSMVTIVNLLSAIIIWAICYMCGNASEESEAYASSDIKPTSEKRDTIKKGTNVASDFYESKVPEYDEEVEQ